MVLFSMSSTNFKKDTGGIKLALKKTVYRFVFFAVNILQDSPDAHIPDYPDKQSLCIFCVISDNHVPFIRTFLIFS